MSTINTKLVETCLQGMECKNCMDCKAEKESWSKFEQDKSTDDLRMYYMVKAKRKAFEQKSKGEYLTISEPEMLGILARY